MRIYLPEISWHDREPIYSCSFDPSDCSKFATSGGSKQIRIWRIHSAQGDLQPSIEFLSEISWHTRTVNVVRFCNVSGEILASGGDDAVICLSQLAPNSPSKKGKEDYLENWQICKTLRGHLEDVLDIAWSSENDLLFSASVDNAFIVWNVRKGTKQFLMNEGHGFVQGICVDCDSKFICTLSSDRTLRVYDYKSFKKIFKISKLGPENVITSTGDMCSEVALKSRRLFHDKEYGAFMRRLSFTIDGQFLISSGGQIDQAKNSSQKMSAVVFHISNFKSPVAFLCTNQESAISAAAYPHKLKHHCPRKPGIGFASRFNLPYRLVVAVLTERSILLYDSEQELPFGRIYDVHYASLTDICWSQDGRHIIAVSIDGYVTFVLINSDELGQRYDEETSRQPQSPIESISVNGSFEFRQFGSDSCQNPKKKDADINHCIMCNEDDISTLLSHKMEESMDFSHI